MSGFPNTLSGTFLVKTETGFQLVNVGGPGSGSGGQPGLPPNLRFSLSAPHPSQPQGQSGPNQPRPQSHQQQPSQQVMVTIPTSQMSVVRPGTVPIINHYPFKHLLLPHQLHLLKCLLILRRKSAKISYPLLSVLPVINLNKLLLMFETSFKD